jgi:hypothetical protein
MVIPPVSQLLVLEDVFHLLQFNNKLSHSIPTPKLIFHLLVMFENLFGRDAFDCFDITRQGPFKFG